MIAGIKLTPQSAMTVPPPAMNAARAAGEALLLDCDDTDGSTVPVTRLIARTRREARSACSGSRGADVVNRSSASAFAYVDWPR